LLLLNPVYKKKRDRSISWQYALGYVQRKQRSIRNIDIQTAIMHFRETCRCT